MKLLTYILAVFCLGYFSDIPKNYIKKIDKEIYSAFDISSYNKEKMDIEQDIVSQLSADFDPEAFFKITESDQHLGYFYFGKAPSKADEFDFVVIFDQEMIIKKVKILAYREDYGGEITSKRWLRQFDGTGVQSSLKYGSDIIGISGATISAPFYDHCCQQHIIESFKNASTTIVI